MGSIFPARRAVGITPSDDAADTTGIQRARYTTGSLAGWSAAYGKEGVMPGKKNTSEEASLRLRLQDLQVFILAIELGGMRKAANQLGISQPFVTRRSRKSKTRSAFH